MILGIRVNINCILIVKCFIKRGIQEMASPKLICNFRSGTADCVVVFWRHFTDRFRNTFQAGNTNSKVEFLDQRGDMRLIPYDYRNPTSHIE